MSRWRPPVAPSSPYITPEGEKALRDELAGLWQLRRTEVVPAITAAAAEGDRSENAEYIYRKKQLAEIDRRIRYLSKRLQVVEIVHTRPSDQTRVYFGAEVTVSRDGEEAVSYRIVGADEIDPSRGWISIDSPLARALLGKSVHDEVKVQLPDQVEACFELISIAFP